MVALIVIDWLLVPLMLTGCVACQLLSASAFSYPVTSVCASSRRACLPALLLAVEPAVLMVFTGGRGWQNYSPCFLTQNNITHVIGVTHSILSVPCQHTERAGCGNSDRRGQEASAAQRGDAPAAALEQGRLLVKGPV